jgi:N-acyl homoserine lactone hydrolase
MKPTYDVLIAGSNLRLKTGFLGISSIVLLEAGGRRILYDTGGYTTRQGLRDAFRDRGLSPGDIDLVFLSHLHFDHSHNINMFPGAKVLVSSTEWEYAKDPHQDDDFMPIGIHAYLEGMDLELFDGEGEVEPGLTFFPAPGHTPGLYALKLETGDRGTVVIAGDAIKYPKEAVLRRCDMAFDALEVGTATIGKILDMADVIVPGHFTEFTRTDNGITWEGENELGLIVR